MAKGSDLLVAALENEGVDRIFGVPGEENLDVVESLRNSSIKLILTRHEQGAAFMAATYGRLRPASITSTCPGLRTRTNASRTKVRNNSVSVAPSKLPEATMPSILG